MAQTRLLYFSPVGVALYRWRAGVLSEDARFAHSDEGRARFAAHVANLKSSVVHVLLDVVEEGFYTDTIPFVRGADRKALLQRRLAQRFRDITLATSISLGYEKTQRREERVLLTSITNASDIQPWLDVLEQAQVPVSGVYSPALLANEMARQLKWVKPRMLLVSLQQGSIRQTYVRNGRARFSRLNPLASEDLTSPANMTAALERETDRLFQYLRTAHEEDESDEVVDAIVIAPPGQIERVHGFSTETSTQLRVQLIDQRMAAKQVGLKSAPVDAGGEALYLHLLATKRPAHQYASDSMRANYGLRSLQVGLIAGGSAIFAACLIAAGLQLVQAHRFQQQIDADQERIRAANATHDSIISTFPRLPTTLDNLRAVLEEYAFIERTSHEPHNIIVDIAKAMDATPEIELEHFDWKINGEAESGGQQELVELTASLPDVSATDFRRIDQETNKFADALRKQTGIEVTHTQLPFDLDSLKILNGGNAIPSSDKAPRIKLTVTRKIDA